jgi:hypothetical protein
MILAHTTLVVSEGQKSLANRGASRQACSVGSRADVSSD